MAYMNLRSQQVNIIFSALICCVAAYALFFVIRDKSAIYQISLTFFDQANHIYPIAFTTAIAIVPASILLVAYYIFKNKRSYFLLLPITHAVLCFSSYAVYGMVALILIWWFAKYAPQAT